MAATTPAPVLVRALANGVRMSPRKVSLVASLVRGRTVADALVILEHTPRRAAKPVAKAIASARASAKNNYQLDDNTLVINTLTVTAGPRLKRFRAGARGMAKPYMKRSSHITVELSGTEKVKKQSAAKRTTATKEEEQ